MIALRLDKGQESLSDREAANISGIFDEFSKGTNP